jgi:hypothetical protein
VTSPEPARKLQPSEDGYVREWIREKLGTAGALVILALAIGLLGWRVLRKDPNVIATEKRHFICSETLKVFEYSLKEGDRYPIRSPYSKKNTGWPAEACYWNADGTVKREPTYVLLNEFIGVEGPTICPDCGKKVVRHNPLPPKKLWDEMLAREGKK